ncbi:hypothetical protein ACC719_36235, partial [Rhizobium ruizarguesonis]
SEPEDWIRLSQSRVRCAPVSNRWNFPKQFLHLVTMSYLSIVHYMAHPKPWHGTFFPWTDKESKVYVDLRKAHPIYNSLYRG